MSTTDIIKIANTSLSICHVVLILALKTLTVHNLPASCYSKMLWNKTFVIKLVSWVI